MRGCSAPNITQSVHAIGVSVSKGREVTVKLRDVQVVQCSTIDSYICQPITSYPVSEFCQPMQLYYYLKLYKISFDSQHAHSTSVIFITKTQGLAN